MVAYHGDIKFSREGVLEHGLGRMLKKSFTGEGVRLTKADGNGTLYLADQGKKVSIIDLEGQSLFVNGNDLLAFEDGIEWDIKMLRKVTAMLAGGLFNVKLEGRGMVAITTHYDPLTLSVSADRPVTTDPNATVAWSGSLSPEFKKDNLAQDLRRPRQRRVDPDVVPRGGLRRRATVRGNSRSGGPALGVAVPSLTMMRAFVIAEPGGAEKLELREVPRPTPRDGWVLIRNRAFGLNRSEWFTRRGDSPSVQFPRVLGIECVGEVVAAPGSGLPSGLRVAAMMGGMGRDFDGSYAEYVLVPEQHVFRVEDRAGLEDPRGPARNAPDRHGSLYLGLEIERASNVLVRGGTSSVGFASISLASVAGLEVTATTRSAAKADELRAAGATHVLVDDGSIANQARAIYPEGFDRVLELVGATTLLDSLEATRRGGIVCMTGILGGKWALSEFLPMADIPTGVKLTSYAGESSDITSDQLQEYVARVESGDLKLKLGPSFPFEQLRKAHTLMDENSANGKIVIEVV